MCSAKKTLPVGVIYLAIIGFAIVDCSVIVMPALSGLFVLGCTGIDSRFVIAAVCGSSSGCNWTSRQGVHRMLGGRLRRFWGSDVGFGALVGGCGGESSGGGGPSVVVGGW